MPYASSSSEHPDARHAVAEVVGEVAEALGGHQPDLAVLFATEAHVDAMGDVAEVVRHVLRPNALIGTTAVSVVGGSHEIEDRPGLSLWAGCFGPCTPLRLDAFSSGDGWTIAGFPDDVPEGIETFLLLVDPFSFPADGFLSTMNQRAGATGRSVQVIGGMASAARGPGGNRLILDDRLYDDGAVGVLLPPGVVETVVSQGCRPIGEPFTVTGAENNVVLELGSRPALDRLRELIEGLEPDERALAQQGLQVGVVIDERREAFAQGDFLIRNLLGIDPDRGGVAIGDVVDVGATVQFQVRDAASADQDLHALLDGREADAALLFTCNGRGARLFGAPDHDASVVDQVTDGGPTAGMFCAGELGPVGGRNFLHGFTASVALFHEPVG
jgi:small ligand-binding sensory domain FIST